LVIAAAALEHHLTDILRLTRNAPIRVEINEWLLLDILELNGDDLVWYVELLKN
jgi:hypothetical protein